MSRVSRLWCPVVAVLVAAASAQYDYVSECPAENGFFADALQCDRYYECQDGEVSEHFCPDGLVFDESSTSYAKCGFPFSIDCTGRSDLQPAQPSHGCPRQHGYFTVPDERVCNKFNFCVDGVPNTITCAGGLIFDPSKGQCDYADQTQRPGCTSDELFSFQCPETSSAHEHSRHPDPEDCSVFFLCISGKARRNSCGPGTVFNPASLSCEDQSKVEGPCASHFNQTYLDSLTTPRPSNLAPSITAGRVVSQEGRRRPRPPQVNRRPVAVQEPVQVQEQIPQQLLDLQNFGQEQSFRGQQGPQQSFRGQGQVQQSFRGQDQSFRGQDQSFRDQQQQSFRGQEPSFTPTAPSRARVPVGRGRPQSPASSQQQVGGPGRVGGEEKEEFFNSLRTSIRGRDRVQERPATASSQPFTRPPRRRPSAPAPAPAEEAAAPVSSFGVRRRARPRPATAEPSPGDLLEQVEAELARRQQQGADSLGPADLDSLLAASQGAASGGGSGLRTRGPVSRGGARLGQQRSPAPPAARGRLQVLENRRPALQPQPEEEETEFRATASTFRQRQRG